MILSNQLIMSDDQAITATVLSTNVIDFGDNGTPAGATVPLSSDLGIGNEIDLFIGVTETFNNLTSLTVALETGGSDVLGVKLVEQTATLAQLKAGYRFNIDGVARGSIGRYLGLSFTVTGAAPTTGKITAGVKA